MDLWTAAEKGAFDRVQHLITRKKNPALVSGRDEQRRTALQLAAQGGHDEICEYGHPLLWLRIHRVDRLLLLTGFFCKTELLFLLPTFMAIRHCRSPVNFGVFLLLVC
jgi:hypothetical protein